MILTAKEIVKKIKAEFKNAHVVLTDADYATPDRYWLSTNFYWAFKRNLMSNNLYQWKEYHDCDNKAFRYWQFASDCHARTMMLREKQGLPIFEGISVGVFFFKQETRYGHAVNFAITKEGVEFIEPQNGQFIKLTKEERETAWFAIF